MKLLDVITEDPVEKIDILKQFAKDAPVPPKKSTPAPVKPTAPPASKAPAKKSVTLEATGLGAHIEQAAKADGITGAHLANFMAQCKVETAGFKSLIEWSSGQQYEGRKDLGNTHPGDGERFKGRGFLHLTGRENYTRCNNDCGWRNTKLDIVRNPDLVSTNLQIAVASALWYWNLFIRSNYKPTSIVAVSTRVNGTNPNGLNARISAFKDYCSKLGIRIQNIVAPVRKATKHAEIEPTGDTQVAANDTDDNVIQTDLAENQTEQFCPNCGGSLSEEGKASRALCTSGRPDSALGASQLASCKSQGLRARDGEKSHLITHGARKVRVTVGGKKIKGKRYGGPLPDYGTRKNQLSEADAPKVYAIGDSHAEGLSYTKGIINYAHGGQPSTSNTNYSGNYNGHPTGIENVPDGSFVVISQGCNDAANSSRAYQDSRGKTPLVSPETIASHVSKLVHAAEAKRCKVVFVLFPNGDAKIKPYYGGPYQAKVREAIKSAVGVPVIDLEGSTLSDGVHAIPADYKNAGSKVLSVFKIINEELSVPWSGRDPAFNDIQKALISIGYKDVTVNGILDKPTQLALMNFQKNSGLQVTGSANVETLKQLDRVLALTTPSTAKTDTASTTATPPAANKPEIKPETDKKSKPSTDQKDPNVRPTISNNMNSYEGRNSIMKYLLDKKVELIHVQGIMLNMAKESKFDSGAYVAHDTKAKKGTPEWLAAGPSGGLCQWHDSKKEKRFTNMMNACGGEGAWQKNWQGQLDFLLSESLTQPYLKKPFKTIEEASEYWTKYWEFPNNAGQEAVERSGAWYKFFHRGK